MTKKVVKEIKQQKAYALLNQYNEIVDLTFTREAARQMKSPEQRIAQLTVNKPIR